MAARPPLKSRLVALSTPRPTLRRPCCAQRCSCCGRSSTRPSPSRPPPRFARFTHRLLPALVSAAARRLAAAAAAAAAAQVATGDAAQAVIAALRWLTQLPLVGGARLAAATLALDASRATEGPLLGRLLLLQSLLRLAGCAARAGTGGGDDPRPVPLGAAARFLCDAYGRGEPSVREAALQTALLLQSRTGADSRVLAALLRSCSPSLLGALREAAPPPAALGAPGAGAAAGVAAGLARGESHEEATMRARLTAAKTREAELLDELKALRTRHRRESRPAGAARAVADGGALPTVQSELAELGRERDRVDERVRQLRQQRLRVRPKDLQTFERARALERAHFASSPQLEGVKQLHRVSAAAAAGAHPRAKAAAQGAARAA